jgi:hypothetical protein
MPLDGIGRQRLHRHVPWHVRPPAQRKRQQQSLPSLGSLEGVSLRGRTRSCLIPALLLMRSTNNSTYVDGDFNQAKVLDAIYIGRNNVVSWLSWQERRAGADKHMQTVREAGGKRRLNGRERAATVVPVEPASQGRRASQAEPARSWRR